MPSLCDTKESLSLGLYLLYARAESSGLQNILNLSYSHMMKYRQRDADSCICCANLRITTNANNKKMDKKTNG